MTEFTEEQKAEIEAEKRKAMQEMASYMQYSIRGDSALKRAIFYLEEDVARGMISKEEVEVLKIIHQVFRWDRGLDRRPQQPAPVEEQKPE